MKSKKNIKIMKERMKKKITKLNRFLLKGLLAKMLQL